MKACPTCAGRGVIPDAKLCANESCGKHFTVQEGRTVLGQHRLKGVMYCSRACARAQAERNRRRRRKATPAQDA